MFLNPWSSMRENVLLPEGWGSPDSMRKRGFWLDIIARSLGALPFAYELQRTIGPYSDRLVFECTSESRARRFCQEVNGSTLHPLLVGLWANCASLHSNNGRLRVIGIRNAWSSLPTWSSIAAAVLEPCSELTAPPASVVSTC